MELAITQFILDIESCTFTVKKQTTTQKGTATFSDISIQCMWLHEFRVYLHIV